MNKTRFYSKTIQKTISIILSFILVFSCTGMPLEELAFAEKSSSLENTSSEPVTLTTESSKVPGYGNSGYRQTSQALTINKKDTSTYPVFYETETVADVEITVSADAGVFPKDATLNIEQIDDSNTYANDNVVKSYSFDIKVINSDGEELQPADSASVNISFKTKEVSNANLDCSVFHVSDVSEQNVTELVSVVEDDTVIVETDGFSIYTVEFTYEDKEYVLEGDSYVKLYDLLSFIGLNGEVESWEISDTTLFNIVKGTEDEVSYDYEIIDENIYEFPVDNPDGDTLYVVPIQMFNTEEWMKVVIEGIEYEIKVTDDNIYQNVPSSYSGNISTNNDSNIAITGDPYFLNAPKPDYVMQSQSTTSATDFAAGLPLSTIFIDVAKIGNANNIGVQGEFTLLTENEAIRNGFEHYYTADGSGSNANMQLTGDVVTYNPLADTENLMQIEPNKINVLEGDLFQFIYRDAAILPNGNTAHVKIVYSNAKIAVDQRLGVTDTASGLTASNYQGAIYLARGGTVARGGTDERYLGYGSKTLDEEPNQPFSQAQKRAMVNAVNNTISTEWGQSYTTGNLSSAPTPALGQSIDVKYQVVDDDGNPIDGTFIFAVTGINLDRDPYSASGNNAAKPLWTYTKDDSDTHFFSEAMSINQGKVSDYIYVRPNTNVFESNELKQQAEASNPPSQKLSYYYAQVIEDSNGNVKFIGNNYNPSSLGGHDMSYNAGFVVLANAKDGITITSTGHATSRLGMNTQAWGGVQIWYRYTSWTGPGGNIQTTSEGNYGGSLNDASDHGVNSNILDAGTYVVPEGKDVTYTMTPNDGYQIKRLRVKNANGSLREIKFNSKPLSTMEEGNTYSFNDAAGRRCTLTALADGKFKLVMPYAKHDEEVRVEWERTTAEIKIKKSTVDNLSGTFNFKVKAHKKEDVTTYAPELIGSVWKDAETGLYSMQLAEGITCALELNELVGAISPAIYSQRLEIEDAEYAWGNTLWKTNLKLSDLGFNIDDDLFVGFANIPSSVEEETVSIALNTGYSAAGPERIYIYNPKTTLNKDVITYWNFNTLDGQETDPGWHNFTVDAGDEKILTVQKGYEYEVQEVNNANWELLDIDGNPIQYASGVLNDEVTQPEHEFLNREVPDLTINKKTVNDIPGTFEFKVKAWVENIEEYINDGLQQTGDTFKSRETLMSEILSTISAQLPQPTEITDELLNSIVTIKVNMDSIDRFRFFDGELTFKLFKVGELTSDGQINLQEPFSNSENQGQSIQNILNSLTPISVATVNIDYTATFDNVQSGCYIVEMQNGTVAPIVVLPTFNMDTNEFINEMTLSAVIPVDLLSSIVEKHSIDLSSQLGAVDSDGYYHFTLDNNESLTIPNLPYGAKYEVIEVAQNGWRLSEKENDTGEITNNTTATFTNEKMVSLKIKKETDVATDEEFEFKIKIYGWQKVFKDTVASNTYSQGAPGYYVGGDLYMTNGATNNAAIIEWFENYYYDDLRFINGSTDLGSLDYYYIDTGRLLDEHSGDYFNGYSSAQSPHSDDEPTFVSNSFFTGDEMRLDIHYYMDLSEYGCVYDIETGINTFKLKVGEVLTIPEVPYGYEYEIYEIDKNGNEVAIGDVFNTKWELKSKTNDSGTLTEDSTSVFTNEMKKGSINVKKETKGNEEGEFNFKVKVWDNTKIPGTLTKDYVNINIDKDTAEVLGETLPQYHVSFGFENTSTITSPVIINSYTLPDLSFDAINYSSIIDQISGLPEEEQSQYDLQAYNQIASILSKVENGENVYVVINGKNYSVVYQAQDSSEDNKVLKITSPLYDLTEQLGDAGSDGYYEFTLQNGENLVIEDVPFGYKYVIYEETPNGWDLVSIDGDVIKEKAEGTIESEEPYEHTFLNAKRHKLTFEKQVTGNMADTNKEFEFKVRVYGWMTDMRVIGEYAPEGHDYQNHASMVYFRDEDVESRFMFNYAIGSKTLLNGEVIEELDEEHSGTFENGTWIVYSETDGSGCTEDLNTATYVDGELVELVPYTVNPGDIVEFHYLLPIPLEQYGSVYDEKGYYTFKLKHGDKIEIEVPYGYEYEVVETDYSSDGYDTLVDNVKGREITGTLTQDKDHVFTNKLRPKLKISKVILGAEAEPDKDFEFVLTSDSELEVDTNIFTKSEESTSESFIYTFALKGGEEVEIDKIPFGTNINVIEKDSSATGYTTTIDGTETRRATLANIQENHSVVFTNLAAVTFPITGSNGLDWLVLVSLLVVIAGSIWYIVRRRREMKTELTVV